VVASCHGDLNDDGQVNISDLATLLSNYGLTGGATYEQGDLDGDGDIDLSDLANLLSVYGAICW
jgi:Ca2+-binding EF-hand superfamily protein